MQEPMALALAAARVPGTPRVLGRGAARAPLPGTKVSRCGDVVRAISLSVHQKQRACVRGTRAKVWEEGDALLLRC